MVPACLLCQHTSGLISSLLHLSAKKRNKIDLNHFIHIFLHLFRLHDILGIQTSSPHFKSPISFSFCSCTERCAVPRVMPIPRVSLLIYSPKNGRNPINFLGMYLVRLCHFPGMVFCTSQQDYPIYRSIKRLTGSVRFHKATYLYCKHVQLLRHCVG